MSKEDFLRSQLDRAIQIAEGRRVDLEGRQAIIDALERLLLELTPGGSEFHGNPGRCAQWAQDQISMTGKLAAERNRLRIAADALLAASKDAAKFVAKYVADTENSTLGQRALDRLEKAMREYWEVSGTDLHKDRISDREALRDKLETRLAVADALATAAEDFEEAFEDGGLIDDLVVSRYDALIVSLREYREAK